MIDRLDQSRRKVVPISFRTDGRWVWSDAVDYFLAEYGVAPDKEFRRHIKASRYMVQAPDKVAVAEALSMLTNWNGGSIR